MPTRPTYRVWTTRNKGYVNLPRGRGRKYFPGAANSRESVDAYNKFCDELCEPAKKPTQSTITVAQVGAEVTVHGF